MAKNWKHNHQGTTVQRGQYQQEFYDNSPGAKISSQTPQYYVIQKETFASLYRRVGRKDATRILYHGLILGIAFMAILGLVIIILTAHQVPIH